MLLRISFSIFLLISVLYFPFWVSVLLLLAGMIYFSLFLEGVFLFLVSDLFYGVKEVRYFEITFISFGLSLLLLLGIEFLKKKIRLYQEK